MLTPASAANAEAVGRPLAVALLRPLALFLLTLSLTALAGRGLLGPVAPHGHDTICHAIATEEYAHCFRDGLQWPRWLPDLSAGYGGPDPIFYAPLVFQASGRLHAAGLSIATALNLTELFALALSVLGMFLWAETIWGWAGGVLAAVLYLFAPYHLCDVYVRCALPELVAMGIAPWLFYFTRRHLDGDPHAWRWLAIALALTVGTHTLSIVLYGGLLAVYATGLLLARGTPAPGAGLVRAGLLAVALSGAFWVPVLAESPGLWLVHNGFSERTWPASFLTVRQLADEPWHGAASAMPLHVGWPAITLAAVALLVAAALYATRSPGILAWWGFAAAVAAHLALTHEVSTPLWQHSFLPMLEFPWRFLAPVSLGLAVLVPIVLRPLAARPVLGPAAHLLLSAALVAASLSSASGVADPGDWPTADALRATSRTATHYPMYVPTGARPTLFPGRPRFAIAAGDAALSAIHESPQLHRLHVSAHGPAVLEARLHLYEGWRASVDGAPATLEREDACGGMRLALDPGEHDVELAFGSTPLRTLSLCLSLCAALTLCLAGRAARVGLATTGALLVACSLGLLHRCTPLGPNFHAGRALALLEAQRYVEAGHELEQVPSGTSRQPWALEQSRLLGDNGLTASCWRGDLTAPPELQRRYDLLVDPMVAWSLPAAAPFTLAVAAALDVPADGDYGFALDSVGTAVLTVDGIKVAGGPAEHAAAHQEGRAHLTRGPHALAVAYRTRGPEVALRVFWTPPGAAPQLVPLSACRRVPVPLDAAATRALLARP